MPNMCNACGQVHPNEESAILCAVGSHALRRLPDGDLVAETTYYRREVVESKVHGKPCQTQQWRLNSLVREVNRRRELAKIVPFHAGSIIPDNVIDEIKRRATGPDFIEFVERRTDRCAIKRGKNYWIHCPVHHERGPSCCIYPEGRVHCYGCKFDVDVFGLLMDMPPNLSFVEAVKEAASFFRVDIPAQQKPWKPADGIAARG
jgi:hypothetical protein